LVSDESRYAAVTSHYLFDLDLLSRQTEEEADEAMEMRLCLRPDEHQSHDEVIHGGLTHLERIHLVMALVIHSSQECY